MKRKKKLSILLAAMLVMVMLLATSTVSFAEGSDDGNSSEVAELAAGVNVISESVSGKTYNVSDGIALAIAGGSDEAPITISNCIFNISGDVMFINGSGIGYNGETKTRLGIGKYVTFENCTFIVSEGATNGSSGNYAAITFFDGTIAFNGSSITGNNWQGQFMGLYGSANVTFKNSTVATTGNTGGWSYAMYSTSVLTLDNSVLSATGMLRASGGGNINAFYSGDLRTGYDAIFIKNGSTVNFSDNQAGGFALNNVNIYVDNSTVSVTNNLGNGCNSGYWTVTNGSTIRMNGNRGGHGLSCIGFDMSDSTLQVLHNGYAGVYVQSKDSALTNCKVDIRCNGEKLLSYSAGDLWLNTHTLTVIGGTSDASEGSPWLGAVGRKGSVITYGTTTVVAYDLNSNAADNLKSNTTATLTYAALALNGEEDSHVLFLNPFMTTDYARGNGESTASSNDVDLFADDNVTSEADIIGKDKAKIGTMTTAQLSHHNYDWDNGQVTAKATETTYGVLKYDCTDVCNDYIGNTETHTYSFDCTGASVYAPLVGLTFDANTDDEVTSMSETQDEILYGNAATEPTETPVREGYQFMGWYTDAECTQEYDFSMALTTNWTTVYAKWEKQTSVTVTKTWDDEDDKYDARPDSITIRLYADGEETANAVVTEETDWTWTFENLDVYAADGSEIVYTISEDEVTDYTTEIDGYDVTNTYSGEVPTEPETPTEPEDPTEPETPTEPESSDETTPETETTTSDSSKPSVGDMSNLTVWIIVAVMCGAAFVSIIVIKRLERR